MEYKVYVKCYKKKRSKVLTLRVLWTGDPCSPAGAAPPGHGAGRSGSGMPRSGWQVLNLGMMIEFKKIQVSEQITKCVIEDTVKVFKDICNL